MKTQTKERINKELIIRYRTQNIKKETSYCKHCGFNHYSNIGYIQCQNCGKEK